MREIASVRIYDLEALQLATRQLMGVEFVDTCDFPLKETVVSVPGKDDVETLQHLLEVDQQKKLDLTFEIKIEGDPEGNFYDISADEIRQIMSAEGVEGLVVFAEKRL